MHPLNSRRELLASMGLGAALWGFGRAHGLAMPRPAVRRASSYSIDHEGTGAVETAVHGGNGRISVKAFSFDGAAEPSLMLLYSIPPGASEGVHTHKLGDRRLGSYDEFYYIAEGAGVMEIDGAAVPVKAGDHVFTPLGLPHGIRNTSPDAQLKVFLTAIERT